MVEEFFFFVDTDYLSASDSGCFVFSQLKVTPELGPGAKNSRNPDPNVLHPGSFAFSSPARARIRIQ